MSTTKPTSTTAIMASAVTAVARRSIAENRSSRRSSRPRTVSLRRATRYMAPLKPTMMASAITPSSGLPPITNPIR